MKINIFILFLLFTLSAIAKFPSAGMVIYYKSDEIIVNINDVNGEILAPIMDAYTVGEKLEVSSRSKNITLSCERCLICQPGYRAHSCTFKFSKYSANSS